VIAAVAWCLFAGAVADAGSVPGEGGPGGAIATPDTVPVARIAVVSAMGGAPPGLEAEARAARAAPRIRIDSGAGAAIVEAPAAAGTRVTFLLSAPGHLRDSLAVVAAAAADAEVPRVVLALDPVELPGIEAAVRWTETGHDESRSVARVRFADAPVPWTDLGEWLSSLPGLVVRSTQAGGGQAVSVRGSRPEGVLVLLDGIPINDPMTGQADLSTVPVASLESATLVRGAGSARHGSGALAGVLLLNSRRPEGSDASGAVRVGSFGGLEGEAALSAAGRAGRVALTVATGRTENDFAYTDRTASDRPSEVRRNADGTYLATAVSAGRGPLRLDLRYDGLERGTPGPAGTTLYDEARWRERRLTAALGWRSGRGSAALRAGRRTTLWTPRPDSRGSATRGLDVAVAGELRVPAAADLLLSARLRAESLAGDALRATATRATGGIAAALPLHPGRATLEPALALDVGGGRVVASPELGGRLPVGPGLALRARAGQAFRLPSFGDLYFASSWRVQANSELRPERVLLDAEVGLEGAWEGPAGRLDAGASGWYRVTDDPIVWLASSVAAWSPRNLDRLTSSGLELRLEATSGPRGDAEWRARAAATLDRSRLGFGANRNPVPYRPATTASIGLERGSRGWAGRAELRWTGPRTTSVAATRTLPGFVLLDLAVAKRLRSSGPSLEVELRIENLLDRGYELVELYPEPGRRLSLTLRSR